MAVYDVGGEQYEIPDEVKGEQLQRVLRGIVQQRQPTSMTAEQVAEAQQQRIAQIPEITGSLGKLSGNLGFLQAVGGLTAFDPDEFGKILTSADPNIGIVTTPEGERIAVNNETGAAFSVNKLGPSLMDAVQFGGALAAFTPAGRAGTIGAQAAGGLATQAGIELGQRALGGEVNPLDVVMAGAAPVVMSAAGKQIKQLPGRARAAGQYIDDLLSGGRAAVPQAPVPQRAAAAVQESAKRAGIRKAIQQGSAESVGWTVDKKGNIVADALQRDLSRKGVHDRAIVTLRDMSRADKDAARKMLDLAENYIKGVKGAERSRPQMVVGENAMKRFDVIQAAQKEASKKVGEAVKTDLKGAPADITPLVDDFMDQLDELGIKVVNGAPNFKESMIRGSNVAPIRNVLDVLKYQYDDAAELHKLKQFISNQLDYDNPATKPLDRQAENALKQLRSRINDQLRGMSENYASANDEFRKAAEAVKPFADVMGRRFDPESSRVENYVGQELRKVLTNYQSANDMIISLDNLDSVAREFGGQFDDDLMSQIVLNSELERIFGTFAPGSAQGVAEKAIEIGLDRAGGGTVQAARDIAKAGKDRLFFTPQSKEKVELIGKMKDLLNK